LAGLRFSGDNTGWPDHVGIVEKVSGKTITVIEGNKSNAVGRRTLQVGGKYIRGYGVPKYSSTSGSGSTPTPTRSKENGGRACQGSHRREMGKRR
jgi:hypothetical protein